MPNSIAEIVAREVAELPDRTSPDGAPDMMLVSHDELVAIVNKVLADHPSVDTVRLNTLRQALGSVQNGSNSSVSLSQDDATRDFIAIWDDRRKWTFSGSFRNLLDKMKQEIDNDEC